MESAIIVIGNEVLSGETLDTNSQFVGKILNEVGFNVKIKIGIPDEKQAIFDAINQTFKVADLVIMSGGLGPTNDDITKKTLTEFFETKLEFRQEVFDDIMHVLKGREVKFPDLIKYQAMIPEMATTFRNQWGTASGLCFNVNGKILIALPGVPYELRGLMEFEVMPYLKERNISSVLLNRNIKTIGVPESTLADEIKDIENDLPSYIKLAYLPSLGQVKLRLTAQGKNEFQLNNELTQIIEQIKLKVGEHIYGYDDETIQEVIGRRLYEKGLKIGTAESCSGGYIAHQITLIPGSSNYFKGSIVSYSNDVKINSLNVNPEIIEKYGAVSQKCVEAMAKGAAKALGVDFALATSGIAGPDGGTEDKPVGTIWLGLASEYGVKSKKIMFNRGREQNIKLSATYAFLMLWEEIKNWS